jgi:hypothetical protein
MTEMPSLGSTLQVWQQQMLHIAIHLVHRTQVRQHVHHMTRRKDSRHVAESRGLLLIAAAFFCATSYLKTRSRFTVVLNGTETQVV